MLRFCIILLTFILASCSSRAPVYPQLPMQETPAKTTPATTLPAAPDNLSQAVDSLPPQGDKRQRYLLAWAQQYLSADKVDDARSLLDLADPKHLTDKNRLKWSFLMAQVALTKKQPQKALAYIDDKRLAIPSLLAKAPAKTQTRFQLLRADALLLDEQLVDSLKLRIDIDRQLDDKDQRYNEQLIWTLLIQISTTQLTALADGGNDDTQGWVKLASIYRNSATNLQQQSEQIDHWQQQWPNHPAANHLPAAIQAIQNTSGQHPQNVTVLLPLTGPLAPAGQAIRDGLVSAHYLAESHDDNSQAATLNFIDTNGKQDIAALYRQAVNQGADMVLGPLAKELVDQLEKIDHFPVPVLTFNYSSDDRMIDPQVVQYALLPEDQVKQIATQLWSEGKRQAGILYPDSDWGQRIVSAFDKEWQALGGHIVGRQVYDGQGSTAVPALLLTNESYQRRRDVGRYTTSIVNFAERPRQDMDFIFLVANADQGRQVKPFINFHYASHLPVVALSYIYEGHVDTLRDNDLNGIRFVDIPWIIDADDEQRREVDDTWGDDDSSHNPALFAMGLDAYRLIGRLALLKASPTVGLPGKTGTLRLDEKNRIHLEYSWATFKQGQAKPTPVVTQGQ